MINVLKRLLRIDPTVWTINLVLLATAGFLQRFGLGILDGARTNFFVDTLGLSGNQVLWLEGIREIPGLLLMFIAALTMRFPLSYRTGVAVIIMPLWALSLVCWSSPSSPAWACTCGCHSTAHWL